VAHGVLAGEHEAGASGVEVLAFGAPACLLEEKGVGYPCTREWKLRESAGACSRSSMV